MNDTAQNKSCSKKGCPCAGVATHARGVYQKSVQWFKTHIELSLGALAVLLVLLSMAFCSHGASTVAVLDVDKLRTQSDAYKKIFSEQQRYEEMWKIKFNAEREVLDREDKDLAARRKSMKAAQLKKEVEALQKKAIALQQKFQAQASQIVMATQTAAKEVDKTAIETIKAVAKKEGYGIVIPKTSTIYTADAVDMTDTFIKELNKKTINVSYPDPATMILPKGN